jgi:hypothetical protein
MGAVFFYMGSFTKIWAIGFFSVAIVLTWVHYYWYEKKKGND